MNNLSQSIRDILIQDVKRRIIQESVPRIKKCLDQLTEEEIWYRPNENVMSVGNLVLHLCGNVRQWILSGLGGYPDHRQRDEEFEEKGPLPTSTLVQSLDELTITLEQVLNQITPETLVAPRIVQGFEETGISILVHVTEHFSYHTGQITYYVKTRKNIDLQYYGGQNLNQKTY